MKTFDLHSMDAASYQERESNVFFQVPEFKARIIESPSDGAMPECDMASYVIFTVIQGDGNGNSEWNSNPANNRSTSDHRAGRSFHADGERGQNTGCANWKGTDIK